MPRTPRSRILSLTAGTAASAGLGMIPMHRLPRTVQGAYVLLPAALTTGLLLRALLRRDALDDADIAGQEPSRPVVRDGRRLPTARAAAHCLALGGLLAGAGAGSILLDRGIENLLRRRGVTAPRVWMGLASGALSLGMDLLGSRALAADEASSVDDRVLDLITEADPMALAPGQADGAPADEYQPEAAAIAAILRADGAISRDRLDEVWKHRFAKPLTDVIESACVTALVEALNVLFAPAPE